MTKKELRAWLKLPRKYPDMWLWGKLRASVLDGNKKISTRNRKTLSVEYDRMAMLNDLMATLFYENEKKHWAKDFKKHLLEKMYRQPIATISKEEQKDAIEELFFGELKKRVNYE